MGPAGSTFLETGVGENNVVTTLTVVGVSGGVATLKANWTTTDCDYNTVYDIPHYYTPWHWETTQTATFAVVDANLDTDSNNDGRIDHATDDPVEDQRPGACLAVYSGHAEELSEVAIGPIGVTPPLANELFGTITFSGNIHVWKDTQRTTEIHSGDYWDLHNPSQVPSVVYVEGETPGESSVTWTVSTTPSLATGVISSDTVNLTLLTSTLTVTNMAPETILPVWYNGVTPQLAVNLRTVLNGITLPSGFDVETAAITGTDFKRGGDVSEHDGDWIYSPHNTYGTNAPWDPYYAYGTDPTGADGTWGGAAFLATIVDGNAKAVKVNINLGDPIHAGNHSGYQFYHKSGSSSADWVDQQATGLGGLMLVGGGTHPVGAYSWFGDQAAHGDIVVIAGNKNSTDLEIAVNALFNEFGGAHAVDGFSFNCASDNSTLTAEALAVALNQQGLGHEFLDKLTGAEGVYFCGGVQWRYVQLLVNDRDAAAIISDGNYGNRHFGSGSVVVGGTSAGLAILGQYVFTGHYGGVTSAEIMGNYYTPNFIQNGNTAIATNILNLKGMSNVLTETHFTDPEKSCDVDGRNIYRLGRFLCFMGSTVLTYSGSAKGLAVDDGTALTVIEINGVLKAKVWGAKNVYL